MCSRHWQTCFLESQRGDWHCTEELEDLMLHTKLHTKRTKAPLGTIKSFRVHPNHLIFDKAVLSEDWKMRRTWPCSPAHARSPWQLCFQGISFLLSSYYCQYYLWFLKLNKFKMYFKSVLLIKSLLHLQAVPFFAEEFYPLLLNRSGDHYFTHTTSETKSNQ